MRIVAAVGVVALLAAGCGGGDDEGADQAPGSTSTSRPAAVLEATIEGVFPAGPEGSRLALRCFGTGAPTIVMEPGTDAAGTEDWPAEVLAPLAERHRTCVYDRAGTSTARCGDLCSDDPVPASRSAADVADDLSSLLAVAEVPGPYLLVGASGGGLVAVEYARSHADALAGLVLLDVGIPNPNLAEELPELAGPANIEHVDWFTTEAELAVLPMPVGTFPLLVVAADEGDAPDQSFWLGLSPDSEHRVLHGGHDLHEDDPEAVVDAILGLAGT